MTAPLYLGIDVGTGSARAGLFDAEGRMVGTGAAAIKMWRPRANFAEHSSDDIWKACCKAVKAALKAAEAGKEQVAGIGIDATCSLVVVDAEGAPVTVDPGEKGRAGDDARNVIVWLDHRAIAQAERINASRQGVLRYVGGKISPEMQMPKLLWLKDELPKTWKRAAHFFDLPDWLVHRATGSTVRSLCTTVCKWTYLGHEGEGRWDRGFFRSIGLEEFLEDDFARIGTVIRPMGEKAGELTEAAARALGLRAGIPVSVAILDAHAGGLGVLGTPIGGVAPAAADLEQRLALIGGTSSCHMAVSAEPRFVTGVWGPYWSAMVPGMWLTEGGQSATGALVDRAIHGHALGPELEKRAKAEATTVYALLNAHLEELAADLPYPAALTRSLHVLPYHHGNRSPRANPRLRGMISGLGLDHSLDALAIEYLATIQAVAYGTRHILDSLQNRGFRISTLVATGGGSKNEVFLREHADITGCRIALPRESEAVLLGSAMLGAVAAGGQPGVIEAMGAMSAADRVIEPAGGEVARFHARKYAVFQRMHDDHLAYAQTMGRAGN
ncbi:MAG TPA: FGGY-family carbohydrate kinase [Planctomycetota bacterium]